MVWTQLLSKCLLRQATCCHVTESAFPVISRFRFDANRLHQLNKCNKHMRKTNITQMGAEKEAIKAKLLDLMPCPTIVKIGHIMIGWWVGRKQTRNTIDHVVSNCAVAMSCWMYPHLPPPLPKAPPTDFFFVAHPFAAQTKTIALQCEKDNCNEAPEAAH